MKHWPMLVVAALALSALTACAPSAPEPPKLDELSSAELEEQAALDLDRWRAKYLGAFPDAELPVVERVRFITNDEWPQMMADCLTEAGFAATAIQDGLSASAPQGQELPFGLAAYTCNAQYPVNPREFMELNEDQIRYLYDYYTQVATPCLEELGFTDLPEPPSRQSYVSSYPGSWSIYDAISGIATEEEWVEANRLCPQTPKVLYGG